MKSYEFKPKDRVFYVPDSANGDLEHPDVEFGIVSSVNEQVVFVKFWPELNAKSWVEVESKACYPRHLVLHRENKGVRLP